MTYLLVFWHPYEQLWIDVHVGYKSYDLNSAHQEYFTSKQRYPHFHYRIIESTTDPNTLPLPLSNYA